MTHKQHRPSTLHRNILHFANGFFWNSASPTAKTSSIIKIFEAQG
jgi:hypothetical protein